MSDEVVAKVVGGKQGLLDLVIEAQLADGHQDRPAMHDQQSLLFHKMCAVKQLLAVSHLPVAQSAPEKRFFKPSSLYTRAIPSIACL